MSSNSAPPTLRLDRIAPHVDAATASVSDLRRAAAATASQLDALGVAMEAAIVEEIRLRRERRSTWLKRWSRLRP